MIIIDFNQKNNDSIKEELLEELKEKLEAGEIDIDKYFHLKSIH